MESKSRARWVWVGIVTAAMAAMMVQIAPTARATQEWHLALNGANTTSGGACGSSALNPWDGTGDYLFGTYVDTSNSGLTFKYSYDDGNTWVIPGAGSHFGDEYSSPPPPPYTYTYVFSDGNGGAYQIQTWSGGTQSPFIIRAIGGIGVPDFTCTF